MHIIRGWLHHRRPEFDAQNAAGIQRQLGFKRHLAQIADLLPQIDGAVLDGPRVFHRVIQLLFTAVQRVALLGHRRGFRQCVGHRGRSQHVQLRFQFVLLGLQIGGKFFHAGDQIVGRQPQFAELGIGGRFGNQLLHAVQLLLRGFQLRGGIGRAFGGGIILDGGDGAGRCQLQTQQQ